MTGTWVRTWNAKARQRDISRYLRAISLCLKEISVIMSSLLPNWHISRMIWLKIKHSYAGTSIHRLVMLPVDHIGQAKEGSVATRLASSTQGGFGRSCGHCKQRF